MKRGEGGGLFLLEDLGLYLLGFCVHFWREGGREGGREEGRAWKRQDDSDRV